MRMFNRDRHEAVSCPKLFDDEETMDSFQMRKGAWDEELKNITRTMMKRIKFK